MQRISIMESGAVGDGKTDNTIAFARAFERIAAWGGGVVTVPPGVWKTGPLDLPGGCTLEIEADAIVSFIPEFERYVAVWTRWEGVECHAMHPCLFAHDVQHVAIKGSGVIDGSGSRWWEYRDVIKRTPGRGPESDIEQQFARLNPTYKHQPGGGGGRGSQFLAPPLIQFFRCTDVLIEGVTVVNSPFWTIHPVFCDFVHIKGVTVVNPYEAPNTDGIDIDSCSHVTISDCLIDVGDDAIALKSGSGSDGIERGIVTSNVVVTGCTVKRAHGGIVIGSETAGGIENVRACGCVFENTDRGIRIKTRRGRGGAIRNLSFSDCTMIDNLCPVAVNMYYRCGIFEHEKTRAFSLDKQSVQRDTPLIENIVISGINATGSKASAAFFVGLPEAPVRNLVVQRCRFSTDVTSPVAVDESDMYEGLPVLERKGVRIRNCFNAVFEDVVVEGPERPFEIEDASSVSIHTGNR